MKKLYVQTPVFESIPMGRALGANVFLKMECYQPTGSFKIRGISELCQHWIAKGKKHLVSSSGGNAGCATAYSGRELGVKVTVFVPTPTSQVYIDAMESMGATVKKVGKVWDEANEAAKKYVEEVDGGFVPPFDHPVIWGGNETLMDEVVTQMQKPDAIVVSVGGGGLSCGILQGLHHHHWPDVPLIGVETTGAASLSASLKADELVTLPAVDTIALTLGAKRVTAELFRWRKRHELISLTVSDQQTVHACRRFLDDHRVLVEPACGASLAVVYDKAKELQGLKNILVVVCGGIGLTFDLLNEYLKKF